jgi:MOSC domain-containing protein YiiM
MDEVTEARLSPEMGIHGTVDRSRRRQVTLLSAEVWEELMRERGASIPPKERRANLLVRGVELYETRGRILRVGSVRLEIGGETTPCERMDALHPGLQDAMRSNWRGGAFARVLDEGMIRVSDEASWE